METQYISQGKLPYLGTFQEENQLYKLRQFYSKLLELHEFFEHSYYIKEIKVRNPNRRKLYWIRVDPVLDFKESRRHFITSKRILSILKNLDNSININRNLMPPSCFVLCESDDDLPF